MVTKRKRTTRQKILDRKLKIDQPEPPRPQKKNEYSTRGRWEESLRKYLMMNQLYKGVDVNTQSINRTDQRW